MPPFVPGIVPGTNRVCPRDKPGEIGLPLCKIRRKPGCVPGFHTGFVPGTNPVKSPGQTRGRPKTNRTKKIYVYVPFSCLSVSLAISLPDFGGTQFAAKFLQLFLVLPCSLAHVPFSSKQLKGKSFQRFPEIFRHAQEFPHEKLTLSIPKLLRLRNPRNIAISFPRPEESRDHISVIFE